VDDKVEGLGPSRAPLERDSQLPLLTADGGWLLTLLPLHEADCVPAGIDPFFRRAGTFSARVNQDCIGQRQSMQLGYARRVPQMRGLRKGRNFPV
jgi:hypothetical protein